MVLINQLKYNGCYSVLIIRQNFGCDYYVFLGFYQSLTGSLVIIS